MCLYPFACVHRCICVGVSTYKQLVTIGTIQTPRDWLNNFYNFYMAALVGIVSSYTVYMASESKCVVTTNLIRLS